MGYAKHPFARLEMFTSVLNGFYVTLSSAWMPNWKGVR